MKSLTRIKLIDSHSDASILLEFNFYLSSRHTSRDGAATDKRNGRLARFIVWGGIFAEGQPSLLGIDGPPRVDSKMQLHRQPCLAATDPLDREGEEGARLAGHGL